MTNEKTRNPFADIAPALGDYTDRCSSATSGGGRVCRRATAAS